MKKRVVVTGMGAVTPLGNDVETTWQALIAGKSGVGMITYFDTANFDAKIAGEVKGFQVENFGVEKKDGRRMDLFVQFAMASADMAMKNSGLDVSRENPERIGVLVGSGIGGIRVMETQHKILLEKGPGRVSPFLIPMLIINMASGHIAIRFGLKGPNTSIATACATGSHAIGEAMKTILRGDAEIMLAGGTESSITPLSIAGFASAKALSTRNDNPAGASRPFDLERDGFVMGEGAGILVLEELEHAKKRQARIYAEVVGYGLTDDAYHMTAPPDDGEGGARAMKMALADAGLNPGQIGYINAHGTSTPVGDKAETAAVKSVFGEHAISRKVVISSTKSMTGHLLGAAGGVEAIACIKTLETGIIHPTINLEHPDPECDLDYVPNQAREMKIQYAMSNSFGFGGHNASLILGKFAP